MLYSTGKREEKSDSVHSCQMHEKYRWNSYRHLLSWFHNPYDSRFDLMFTILFDLATGFFVLWLRFTLGSYSLDLDSEITSKQEIWLESPSMWCDVNVTWTCDIWKRNHRWHKIHCSVQYPLFWPLAPKAVVPPCPLTMIEVPESNLFRGCLFPVGFLRTSIVDACWITSRRTSKNSARIWFRNAS